MASKLDVPPDWRARLVTDIPSAVALFDSECRYIAASAAWIAVFDHPYFAITNASGSFTIDRVPPGTYTLHVWHEKTGAKTQSVTVGPSGVLSLKLEL